MDGRAESKSVRRRSRRQTLIPDSFVLRSAFTAFSPETVFRLLSRAEAAAGRPSRLGGLEGFIPERRSAGASRFAGRGNLAQHSGGLFRPDRASGRANRSADRRVQEAQPENW